jgi:hypothetical protein
VVVLEALLWLKANNKTYYGDIDIDEERLRSLPEDDIPAELLDIVCQSEDIGIMEEESAGYVNNDADCERHKHMICEQLLKNPAIWQTLPRAQLRSKAKTWAMMMNQGREVGKRLRSVEDRIDT